MSPEMESKKKPDKPGKLISSRSEAREVCRANERHNAVALGDECPFCGWTRRVPL